MSAVKTEQPTGSLILRALVPLVILAGGIGGFLALSYGLRADLPEDGQREPVPMAHAAIVRNHEGGMAIQADGVVVPYREIKISAEVSGRIVERTAISRTGHYVEQGQRLATIDPQDYQLEVDRLQEELKQATVALDEWGEQILGTERLIKIASQDLEIRSRELARLNAAQRTAFSLSDLEKAEAAKLTVENSLETLHNRKQLLGIGRARLESARDLAELRHKQALLDLQRTQIIAPVAGVIVADFIEEDSFVQRGTLLLTLEDTSKVEVKCKLQMEDLYWLWDRPASTAHSAQEQTAPAPATESTAAGAYDIPSVPVEVVYSLAGHADREYVWQGQLDRYDGLGLDERTRTVPCRIVVDQPRERFPADLGGPPALLRGMYVSIRLRITPQTHLLEVPEASVRPGNNIWRVRGGKLAIVPVNFVTFQESTAADGAESRLALIYVDDSSPSSDSSVLVAGDQVVVSPLVFVRTGMDIKVSKVVEQARP